MFNSINNTQNKLPNKINSICGFKNIDNFITKTKLNIKKQKWIEYPKCIYLNVS